MSRGLSRLQQGILDLMTGEARPKVYASPDSLETGELLEEMTACGFISGRERKQALFTIRRACISLVRRGLLEGKYVPFFDHCGALNPYFPDGFVVSAWRLRLFLALAKNYLFDP
jgi:hypothetical protein